MTVLIPLLAGLGLAAFVSGVPVLRRTPLADRVEPYLGRPRDRRSAAFGPLAGAPAGAVARLAELLPLGGDLERRLEAAGGALSPDQFRVQQTAWALAGLSGSIGLVLLATSAGIGVDPAAVPAFTLLASVGGWSARDRWLSREVERRRAALADELPPALDLLVLALMAGESVPGAFARLSGLLRGPLAVELHAVLGDVRAGVPIVEALENLSRRVDEPAVARFVDALCTAIEKGAPLADVLRAQADDGRDLRRRALLEMGGRREVWMLVPVVFLIMPVVVVWALFPGLVSLDLLVP